MGERGVRVVVIGMSESIKIGSTIIELTSSHNSDELAVEVEAHRLVALRTEEDAVVFACRDFGVAPGAEHFQSPPSSFIFLRSEFTNSE